MQLYIINSEMYELSEKVNTKFGQPLLAGGHEIVVPSSDRKCTDIICLILFLLFAGAFIGLLTYGLITGDPKKVINVYNSNQVQCYTTANTPYGFFPTSGSLYNAVCVNQCPSDQQTVTCLQDSFNCPTGTITATYSTTTFQNYCVPSITVSGQDLSQVLNSNVYSAWATELQRGWPVLVGALVVAMIASLAYLLMMRCCSGVLVWISITVAVLGMVLIGILFILQSQGIKVSSALSDNLTKLSYNSLLILGIGFTAAGVLLSLLVLCLRTRINMGTKAIQLGSVFLFENCCVVLLPVSQAIFLGGGLAGLIVGGIYLYSKGDFTFPDNAAFPVIATTASQIIIVIVFVLGAIWLLCYFIGCNSFILCSAVSIWYFNHESQHDLGNPFGDSLSRLIRFHSGSVAITGFLNGIFAALSFIANLLSFEAGEEDSGCTACCLKFFSCICCLFKCVLRFLNSGTYVQIAVSGTNYCTSASRAYDIIEDNVTKLNVSDGISLFYKSLGTIGIGVGVTVAAYFCCQQITYLAEQLTTPLVVSIVSGLIAVTVAGVYLSLIDLSAQSIIQSFLIDQEHCNGYPRYARPQIRDMMIADGQ